MCGIIAAVNKWNSGFSSPAMRAFEDLLFMDTLRGPDSTGAFLVDKAGDVTVAKEACIAHWFLVDKEYVSDIYNPGYKDGKVLVGHNRKATIGKVTDINAHPFNVNDELVLVHNGTLSAHKHLGTAEIDSEAIAQYLHDKWDDMATPEEKAKVLAHIGGAWALIWYDLRTNKLNIVRNMQRPLALAETDSEFFFASELDMLQAGLSRNNLKPKVIKNIDAYTVYSFNLEENFPSKVEEVVLPTDPFFPATSQKAGKTLAATTHYSATNATEDELSKSAYKKFLKTIVGKEINFYVEDFVNADKSDLEYYFYGGSGEWTFNHEIVGTADASQCLKVMDAYNQAKGKVLEAKYEKATRKVTITVAITDVPQYEAATTH